ncbi:MULTISPECIES: ABC transporter ATP-binding protein [Pseudothermotoga]|uniref:ABC transporter related n=2 Tax=Pseudothermotoga TaxID=1643951 RepID=A8F509_PSELT|nr:MULTISPECIES: ABC transporter ATP-binding protein [Pseudothermotoga]ABV33243.1 ABC transporter related [Pseudothermotoga lettingae TMO]KUK20736.1 MAG: ABC transporter related [Pseudothermotoga lettingae]MDI3493889.1 ral nucleoside transport system ATP-binding protein [Pseudothermotoga sp.]GLI49840.1 heme ABC transporter ATP-binding protein [Pseudothermotoga lettingae TMO]HBJ81879.1 ABC transporter ATP-binding protein [Pseudothermotoga sp.]
MPYIEMVGIYKVYPPDVVALSGVDLSFERGEIHSIVGENGAGKSTLMKILYGMIKPSAGMIKINGQKVQISNPLKARELGIGMVHQEFMLIQSFKVYENVILGQEMTLAGFIDRKHAKQRVQKIVDKYGFKIDIEAVTSQLSVAAQQKIEIVKQLYREAETLILDEPTAVLTPQESEELFEEIFELRDQGKTVIFISHKLEEVLRISDRITVMRKGKKIATLENKGINPEDLAKMMVGKSIVFQLEKSRIEPGRVVLSIEDLSLKSRRSDRYVLRNVNITVKSGEIVGIAGIEGNGQFELVQTLIGSLKPSTGKITIDGIDVTNMTIRERRKLMSYVPQDRKFTGLALKATILENLLMTHHLKKEFQKGILSINWKKAQEFSKKVAHEFEVVYRNLDESPSTLSGGNQQKIVVGRELSLGYNLIVLDQPTRGLDVASAEYIRNLIIKMRDAGKAVLLISADLEELMQLSDRVYVMRQGKIVASLDEKTIDLQTIGNYMLGVVN